MKKRVLSFVMVAALCLAMAVPAFATEKDVDVKGHINQVSVGPDNSYDVTLSTTVHWWVTKNSTTVVSGNSSGPTEDPTPNSITNNSTTSGIAVQLVSFTIANADAKTISPSGDNLLKDLTLTGDLTETTGPNTNLSDGYSGAAIPYGNLAAKTTWSYGFTGTYTDNSGEGKEYSPTYTMTLGFTFV